MQASGGELERVVGLGTDLPATGEAIQAPNLYFICDICEIGGWFIAQPTSA